MARPWLDRLVIEPTRDLLTALHVGEQVTDFDLCRALCTGVEGVFREEVQAFPGWPPEATTDGLVPGLCQRSGLSTVDLVAMCSIDFDGRRFPLRAAVTLTDDHTALATFVAQIGDVDSSTGAPPRLPATAMILPLRHDDGATEPQLLVGRRPMPIRWTTVIDSI